MGTPIVPPVRPDPVPAGDLCTRCWGIGKALGTDETPSKVTATFFDMRKADNWIAGYGEPLDGDFILEQHSAIPCKWRLIATPMYVIWDVSGSVSSLLVVNIEGYACFSGSDDQCELLIMNQLDNRFTGGSCLITIPEIEEL